VDWGEAIDVPALYGREAELATLQLWVLTDHCRVIALLGLGGIGKTSLALAIAVRIASHFETVIFRSLRNAPPLGDVLDGLIRILTAQRPALLRSLALIHATAKAYVRQSQERLIARPLLELLVASGGGPDVAQRHLLDLLAQWRGRSQAE
jgi:hypothetical protein